MAKDYPLMENWTNLEYFNCHDKPISFYLACIIVILIFSAALNYLANNMGTEIEVFLWVRN